MEVALLRQVFVSHCYAQTAQVTATLVATGIATQLVQLFVLPRVQFLVLVELVSPVLHFAVLLQLVVLRILTVVALHQLLAHMGTVWRTRTNVLVLQHLLMDSL